MSRKRFTGLCVLLMVFLLLSTLALGGCDTADPPVDDDDENGTPAPDPDPDPDPEPELQTINVGMAQRPTTLDPVNHRSRFSETLHDLYGDALVWANPSGQLVPNLTESITMIDPRTYELKIRQGVVFHNGDPMNADDVIFSITRLAMAGGMEGETSPRRGISGNVESLERIDDYTVRVTLEQPSPMTQIRNWRNYYIWPKEYFEEVGPEGFNEHPIGLGAFKWLEGDLSSQVILERFDDYYGGCPDIPGEVSRIPMLDRVIVHFVEEPTTRVAALLAGEIDIIQSVPMDSIKLIENNPDTEIVTSMGTSVLFLGINNSKPPFDDIRVRQALAYAIDYDQIVNSLYLGYGKPLYALPFLEPFEGEPGSGAFSHIQSPYKERNIEKAKALLEDAGVSNLSVVIDAWPGAVLEAQVVAQMLSDIGIDASVRAWEAAVVMEVWRHTVDHNRDLFMRTGGFARRSPESMNVLAGTGQTHNWQSGFYSNPIADELMSKAIPMEDSPERNELFSEAFEIYLEEVPAVFILEPEVVEAIRSNVKNYYPCTQGRINLQKVYFE